MARSPEPVSRHLVGLNEVVVVRWSGEWIKSVQHLSKHRRDSEADEVEYKRAMCYWGRYPEDEWWRIVGIRPVGVSHEYPYEYLELEITFLNPGKAYEEWLASGGTEITRPFEEPPAEIIALLRRQFNPCNDGTLREVRQD